MRGRANGCLLSSRVAPTAPAITRSFRMWVRERGAAADLKIHILIIFRRRYDLHPLRQ